MEGWIEVEGRAKGGVPGIARAVLFDALNLIREHARRGERITIVAGGHHLAAWLLKREAEYVSLRDISYQIRRGLPANNLRGRLKGKLKRLYPAKHPRTLFGVQVVAVGKSPHLRIEVFVTSGTKKTQSRLPDPPPSRDVPLVDLHPPLDGPIEVALVFGLLCFYHLRRDKAGFASMLRHAQKRDLKVPELRKRTIRGLLALLRRRYVRRSRFGLLEIDELAEVQRVALEVWYRHELSRWESASGEQDITGSATRGALARKLGQHEREKHPDELLAEAAARERAAAFQHWALERVEPTDVERSHGRKAFEHAIELGSATLQRIFLKLQQRGLIDDVTAWRDRQFASYKALEEEAFAFAEERGLPTPNIQRAIRRLARPRVQSWTELEARKLFEPGVSPIESEWRLQGMIGQLLQIMDRPRLDGGLEFAVERELRYLMAVYRLLVRANNPHRG